MALWPVATATVGCIAFAGAGVFWYLLTPAHPDYATSFLPGLILCGIGSGCTQAPLFAATSTLPRHQSNTGSALLNMARQIGSAFGVAILVCLLANRGTKLAPYQHGWLFIAAASALAAAVVFFGNTADHRRPAAVEVVSRR